MACNCGTGSRKPHSAGAGDRGSCVCRNRPVAARDTLPQSDARLLPTPRLERSSRQSDLRVARKESPDRIRAFFPQVEFDPIGGVVPTEPIEPREARYALASRLPKPPVVTQAPPRLDEQYARLPSLDRRDVPLLIHPRGCGLNCFDLYRDLLPPGTAPDCRLHVLMTWPRSRQDVLLPPGLDSRDENELEPEARSLSAGMTLGLATPPRQQIEPPQQLALAPRYEEAPTQTPAATAAQASTPKEVDACECQSIAKRPGGVPVACAPASSLPGVGPKGVSIDLGPSGGRGKAGPGVSPAPPPFDDSCYCFCFCFSWLDMLWAFDFGGILGKPGPLGGGWLWFWTSLPIFDLVAAGSEAGLGQFDLRPPFSEDFETLATSVQERVMHFALGARHDRPGVVVSDDDSQALQVTAGIAGGMLRPEAAAVQLGHDAPTLPTHAGAEAIPSQVVRSRPAEAARAGPFVADVHEPVVNRVLGGPQS